MYGLFDSEGTFFVVQACIVICVILGQTRWGRTIR